MIRSSETLAQPPSLESVKATLRTRAHALGFETMRFARPDAIPEAGERLLTFLAEGRHGTMDWMETTADRRRDTRHLWSDARAAEAGHTGGNS